MNFLSTYQSIENWIVTISILARVCHGEKAGSGMLEFAATHQGRQNMEVYSQKQHAQILIGETGAVYGLEGV